MTVSVIDATSACFGTNATNSEPDPAPRLYAGSEPPSLACAFRFPVPTWTTLTSASLRLFISGLPVEGWLDILLGVRLAGGSLPTSAVNTSWISVGPDIRIVSPGFEGDYVVSLDGFETSPEGYFLDIDVTALVQAADTAGSIDTHICFVILDDNSNVGWMEIHGVDPGASGLNEPQLTLTYDESGPLWCPGAVIASSGNGAGLFQLFGAS